MRSITRFLLGSLPVTVAAAVVLMLAALTALPAAANLWGPITRSRLGGLPGWRSSLGVFLGRLPVCALPVQMPDGGRPACGVQGRRAAGAAA